jgi:hypothetical protein
MCNPVQNYVRHEFHSQFTLSPSLKIKSLGEAFQIM